MRKLLTAILAAFLCPLVALAQVGLGEGTSTFGRTIHVHAAGNAAENGAALVAALGSATITDRSDPANEPVLVQLGPGSYQTSAEIIMPNNVGITGAGIDLTTISCSGCFYVFYSEATINRFSDLHVGSDSFTIGAVLSAGIQIDNVRSIGVYGAGFGGAGTQASITNSQLVSSGDNALVVADGANVFVDHSVISGDDSSSGDGIIAGTDENGAPTLYVLYSYIGEQGVTNPWPGTLSCAYISSGFPIVSEVPGCPEAPLPPAGLWRGSPLKKLPR